MLRDISDRKRNERVAGDIQQGMLSSRADLASLAPGVEVDAVLMPARTIGGDFYDAFMAGPDQLCFLLGDVTGKGMPAALFMALSKALSHSVLARAPEDLGAALGAIGAELARNNREAMAVSMMAGVLDIRTGQLTLCNAGHDDPLLLLPDGSVEDIVLEGGPPLCAAPDYAYPVETRQLPPGATLLAVTDGVTEAQGPRGDLFGRERLRKALAARAAEPALPALVDGVVSVVRRFEARGEPSDDLAILAIRRV